MAFMTPRLYLITDRSLFRDDRDLYNAIKIAFKAGLRTVQLREKDLSGRQLFEMASTLQALASDFGGNLFINERVDIAMCVKAAGVHLGQSGIPPLAVRKIAGNSLSIGISTHSLQEAIDAEANGADFITYGPIFETPSKIRFGKPVGLASIKEIKKRLSIPVIALGGINLTNAADVISAGADGLSMIRGILGEKDIANTVKKYLSILGEK